MVPTLANTDLSEADCPDQYVEHKAEPESLQIVIKKANNSNSNISTLTHPSKKSSMRIAPEAQQLTFNQLQNFINIRQDGLKQLDLKGIHSHSSCRNTMRIIQNTECVKNPYIDEHLDVPIRQKSTTNSAIDKGHFTIATEDNINPM